MRRPPFTMKTLENLECLASYALGARVVITAVNDGKAYKAKVNAAIEWIAEMRRWETEQNEKPIEIPVPPGNPSD